jgi:DNA-binding NarL/FixJ family response regulator
MISVLLADDHAHLLKELRTLLEITDDMQVVGTATSGSEAIVKASYLCPDVVVLDISMLLIDGIESARQIRERCPSTGIMMLTILHDPNYVLRSLDVGALGYVLKESLDQDLLPAIRSVSQGKRYFSEQVTQIAEHFFHQQSGDSGTGK